MIYIAFSARQLNYNRNSSQLCKYSCFFNGSIWNGEFRVYHIVWMIFVLYLFWIVSFDFNWNVKAHYWVPGLCRTHAQNCIKKTNLLHATRNRSIFILAPKSARLNTMTNDQHGTTARYVYLTFERHTICHLFFRSFLCIKCSATVSAAIFWLFSVFNQFRIVDTGFEKAISINRFMHVI